MPVSTRRARKLTEETVLKVQKAPKVQKEKKNKTSSKGSETKDHYALWDFADWELKMFDNGYKNTLRLFFERARHPGQCDRTGAIPPGKGDELDGRPFVYYAEVEGEFKSGGVLGEQFYLEREDGSLRHVPDDHAFPPYRPSLLKAPDELYADAVYVKRPAWRCVAWMNPPPPGVRLLAEAAVLTILAKHPHPHIAQFYGCRVRNGRITGLVSERLPVTLADADPALHAKLVANKDRFFAQLRSAVAHLHALGFTHNDIKPHNVMLRADGRPVLIDFDACMPMGARTRYVGTYGWCRPDQWDRLENDLPIFAEPENDRYGLECLEKRFALPGCGTRRDNAGNEAGPDMASKRSERVQREPTGRDG